MKVGILTFHMAHNYGAMLQAYALNHYLQDLGIDSEVIDYRLKHIDQWHRNPRRKELICEYGVIVGSLKWLRRLFRGYYLPEGKKCRFEKFMLRDIGISSLITKEEIEKGDLNYDLIIFGSDQIWNADITGGICREYFGGFPTKAKKVSYAASKGEYSFLGDKEKYKKLLNQLDMISVRESSLVDEIFAMGINNVKIVADPALLLSKEKWECLTNKKYKTNLKDYILVYGIRDDERMMDFAKKVAAEFHKKVVYIVYEKKENLKDIYQIDDAGPKEFLELFRKAYFVITNSFHGTCFSIIFEKQFLVVEGAEGDKRIDSLLFDLNLSNRVICLNNNVKCKKIDYKEVKIKLEDKLALSKKFIEEAIDLVKL